MDEKNAIALATLGPENLLARFVNLPCEAEHTEPAEAFWQQAGELFDTRVPLNRIPPSEYDKFVSIFRRVWETKTEEEKRRESAALGGIFNRFAAIRTIDRPELTVDLTADLAISFNYKSASLLDILALTLIHHRKELGVCERKDTGCSSPYYLKSHGRQRFCSRCADIVRREKKKEWWSDNREHFIKKWRKQRLSTKLRSSAKRKGK